MARGPENEGESSSIALQGRHRLPNGRPVTVRVVRTSLPVQTMLMLVIVFGAFLAGVWAGTSGQYREFANWATTPLSEEALLRRVLLAPDLSERPLLSGRMGELEGQLVAVAAGLDGLQANYGRQAEALIGLRRDVPATMESCAAASVAANGAWNSSFASLERYIKLETTFFGALQTCMAALDAANSQLPGAAGEPPGSEKAAETSAASE